MTDDAGSVWLNGRLVPQAEGVVSVFDHGLLFGDGVFETIFASYGYLFRLDDHLERLGRSLLAIDLEPPVPMESLRDAVVETVRANGLREAYVKIVVTRGVGEEPMLDPRGCTPTAIVFARPFRSWAGAEAAGNGVSAKIVSIRRTSDAALDARIKSLDYLNLVLAKIEATKAGCQEALLADDAGRICEAPGYNVFTVHEGTVSTPGRSILEGITRRTVLELADEAAIPARVRDLLAYDIYTADEVFLTSTAAGIIPVVSVDGRQVGSGDPGPVTEQLAAAYDALQRSGRLGTPVA